MKCPDDYRNQILIGDCLDILGQLPDGIAQTCITSPPYWGLRDYGCDGQLGLEKTLDEYIAGMVAVFREVRRVLRDDGTLWLNIGDSYSNAQPGGGSPGYNDGRKNRKERLRSGRVEGAKVKDLLGVPWLLAFALRSDGWYLRSDIIWHKPNQMPESVTDRPTKSHEYLFLMSKSPQYYYDCDAIREPHTDESLLRATRKWDGKRSAGAISPSWSGLKSENMCHPAGRNKRTVWTINTQPYKDAHFATFPEALVNPCILAGSKEGDIVLDPFGGSGTTGYRAKEMGRAYTLIELNPEYAKMAERRLQQEVLF